MQMKTTIQGVKYVLVKLGVGSPNLCLGGCTPRLGGEVDFIVDVIDDGNSPSHSKVRRCRGLSGLLTIFGKGKLCGLIIIWKMVQRKDEHK